MFEHSNFAVANGPSLLMFKHSNFAEPNVNQTFVSRASVVLHLQNILSVSKAFV